MYNVIEEVYIYWHGPYSLASCLGSEWADCRGIYTISRVFGDTGSLLYIGESYRQTMFERVYSHLQYWANDYRGQKQVRYGDIDLEHGLRLIERRLTEIEALLIYWHQPIHNIHHKNGYWGRDLLIVNEGRRGLLDDIVCTDEL